MFVPGLKPKLIRSCQPGGWDGKKTTEDCPELLYNIFYPLPVPVVDICTHAHSQCCEVQVTETGRGPGMEQVSPVGSANPFEECPDQRRN